jgi:hypothetical protein
LIAPGMQLVTKKLKYREEPWELLDHPIFHAAAIMANEAKQFL